MQIREVRLCPFIAKCIECDYGEKCKYNHDVKTFIENRPKDIGEICYIYEKYGKCPFGLSCRFSSGHIRQVSEEKYENIINVEKYKEGNNVAQIYNVMSADLRTKLWKRKYDFKLSDKIVRTVNEYLNSNKDLLTNIKYHRYKGIVQKKSDGSTKEELLSQEDKLEEVLETNIEPVKVDSKDKKLGLVTDEDLIKLRSCEKRKSTGKTSFTWRL